MRIVLFLGFGLAFVAACTGGSSTVSGPSGARPAPSEDGGAGTVTGDGDPAGEPCDRYLSCVLATTPEAYGAAIQLYGDDSACWKTPGQAQGCAQACTSAFAKIADSCSCEGASCTKCNELPRYRFRSHQSGRHMSCTNGHMFPAAEIALELSSKAGRAVTGVLTIVDNDGPQTVTGTASCTGAFTLTGEQTLGGGDYVDRWTVVVTPTQDPDVLDIDVTNRTTFPLDPERTCTFSAQLTR